MTTRERQAEISKRFHHIGDVAALTGLSADALRAWERVGLLAPQRSKGGVRQYTEDDIARVRLIARTLQRGGFSRGAVAMLLRSGDLRPDAADYAPGPARARPSRAQTGAPGDADMDGQRSDRRMLAAIARIGDALASGRGLDEVLDVICAETCWAFGVSDAVLWLAEPIPAHPARGPVPMGQTDGATPASPAPSAPCPHALVIAAAYRQQRDSGRSDRAARSTVPLDDRRFPAVRAFLTRRSLVVTTQELSALAHPELDRLLPGATLLCMPLLASDGEPLGVLALRESRDAERFGADDLERIRLFAVHGALAVETARLHAAIRAAQVDADTQRARWQAAVDDLPALVCICDVALHITYVSPTCRRVLGWPAHLPAAAEQPARSGTWSVEQGFFWLGDPAAIVAPLSLDELPLARALRERLTIHDITVVHRCPDGIDRLIVWDAAPMPDAQGRLLGAVAVGRDVTAEHRRRERELSLAAVAHAAAGAPASEGVEARAAQILSALVENTRTPVIAATLYLLDDTAGVLRRVAAADRERSGTHAPALPITPQHPWWQLLIAGSVYSTRDRERPGWLRAIGLASWKASGMRAWATVPLRSGGTLVGALAIGLNAPHVWDAAERTWLEACAATIAMAVENGRLLDAKGRRSQGSAAPLDGNNEAH